MPTDFEAYIEIKSLNGWQLAEKPITDPVEIISEYYCPFTKAFLYGGISLERGLPNDISSELKKYYNKCVKIDSTQSLESWLTLKELKEADWKGAASFYFQDHENLYNEVINKSSEIINTLESYNTNLDDIRIVYWCTD